MRELNPLPFEFFTSNALTDVVVIGIRTRNLERAIGFEPMMIGFADQRLCPLGYARLIFGEDDGTRTRNLQLEGLAASTDLPTSSENAREKIRTFT